MQGHNSAAYGQELLDDIETVLGDDHKKLFHFAKWHIEDYLLGTEGMKLEHEGAYMRFLMRLYQRGKPLPDDDRYMSTLMRLSVRVWKRVKDALVSVGKIIVKRGCLTNARFERERKERAEQLQKQADATRKQWEKQRAEKAGIGKVSAKFDESLGEVSAKLSQNEGEKHNEINGSKDGQPDITRESKNLEEEKERKKENYNTHPGLETAREAAGVGEVQVLNGATSHIVKTLGEWINPIMPDHKTARGWLESSVSMYGGVVVRDSFAELEAKVMQGDIVARPIPLLTKICQRRKGEKAKSQKPDPMAKIYSGVR